MKRRTHDHRNCRACRETTNATERAALLVIAALPEPPPRGPWRYEVRLPADVGRELARFYIQSFEGRVPDLLARLMEAHGDPLPERRTMAAHRRGTVSEIDEPDGWVRVVVDASEAS